MKTYGSTEDDCDFAADLPVLGFARLFFPPGALLLSFSSSASKSNAPDMLFEVV